AAVGGSDVHFPGQPGNPDNPLSPTRLGRPTIWIYTKRPLSPKAIIDAIKAGNCFISDAPDGPQIYMTRENDLITARIVGGKGTALDIIGANGIIATEAITEDDQSWSFALNILGKGQPYVRSQVHTEYGGLRALS